MKKMTALVILATFVLTSLIGGFTSVSAMPVINEAGLTTIRSVDYDRASNVPNIDGSIYLVFTAGNWLEYDIIAPAAGEYNLNIVVGSPGNFEVTALVNGTDSYVRQISLTAQGMAGYTTRLSQFVAKIALSEGQNTLRLTFGGISGNCYFTELRFDPLPPVVKAEERSEYSVFEYRRAIETLKHESASVSFNGTHGLWLEFEVYAQAEGIYDFYLLYGSEGTINFTALINETTTVAGTVPPTGTLSNYEYNLGARMALNQGINTIRLTNAGGGAYLRGIAFEKAAVRLTDGVDSITVEAIKYMRAHPDIKVETDKLSFQLNHWIEYDLLVEKEGYYSLSVDVGSPANMSVGVKVNDDEQFSRTVAKTDASYTRAKRYIADIKLNAGYNTIRLTNTKGSYYLQNAHLEYTDEPGKLLTCHSFDYINAIETIRHESEYLSFQNGHWVEYEFDVPKAALYELYMKVGTVSNANFNITVNNTDTYTGSAPLMGYLTPTEPKYITKIALTEGKNIIKIENVLSSLYFNGVILEKYYVEVPAVGSVTAPAIDYMRAIDGIRIEAEKISFQPADWVEYDLNVQSGGQYLMSMAVGTPYDGQLSVLVNDTDEYSGAFNATGTGVEAYSNILNRQIAEINLLEGSNTIRIINAGDDMYFKDLIIESTVQQLEPFITRQGEEHNIGGQNAGYYDTTIVGGIELINDDTAVELVPTEWFKYDIIVENSGYYRLKLFTTALEESVANITVDDKEPVMLTLPTTSSTEPQDFVLSDGLNVYLTKGVNTIKIGCTSGTFYMDYFNVYMPLATFYHTASELGNETTLVTEGTMVATVVLDGIYEGEDINYYFAIYKTDSYGNKSLYKVAANNETVRQDTILSASINDILIDEAYTYSAKVFVWNNMSGSSFVIGE
jgi:hypothetical protein